MSWSTIRRGAFVVVEAVDHCKWSKDHKAKKVKGYPAIPFDVCGKVRERAREHITVEGRWRDEDKTIEYGIFTIAKGAVKAVADLRTGKGLYDG